MSTRRSPAQFRSKAASIVAFFLSLALVAGAVYLGYQALFFDYSGYLPSGATVREYLRRAALQDKRPRGPFDLEIRWARRSPADGSAHRIAELYAAGTPRCR